LYAIEKYDDDRDSQEKTGNTDDDGYSRLQREGFGAINLPVVLMMRIPAWSDDPSRI
jgi:hypothetical protein